MDEQQAYPYMRMAIEEMRKSIAEPRDDKVSPSVGAVLVFPDGEVVTAYRGELRYGQHAEFILLERKCGHRRLDDAVLFVTLEPCAPGSRNPPKKGCAEHVYGARIKEVWIGVTDPEPTVARQGMAFLQGKGVDVRMFPKDLQDLILDENVEFLDGAHERAEQTRERVAEPMVLSPLDRTTDRLTLASLSSEALGRYKKHLGFDSDEELHRALLEEDLLVGEELKPTGFGELLFGTRPRSRYPQAAVIASVTYPDGAQENEEFAGPLVEIPDAIETWLKSKTRYLEDRNQMQRTSDTIIPLQAIREGVVNALIHRDYDIEGAKIQLDVTPEAITISSPGKPVPPITLEQLASFSAPTLSRNPKLHHIFRQMNLAEEAGRGMKTMKALRSKEGGVVPSITFNDPYLVLTLHTSAEAAASELAHADIETLLSPEELAGWEFLARAGGTTRSEYAAALGVTARTASRHLGKFVQLGLASREGQSVATRYRPLTGN